MNFKEKIRDFFKILLPWSWAEWWVFTVFFALYGALASFIALNYRIVFDDRIPWDAYFSFDNRSIVMTGGGFERHPLSNYFFDLLRSLALMISGGDKGEIFRLVLSMCSAIAVSMAVLQVFKYLRNIIRLPLWISILLMTFFGLFSTNILLAFTPETYTYTLFLLCFFNYYAALRLRKEEKIPATALTLATISVGGFTVTNAAKVFIPVFFEKNLFKSYRTILNALLRMGISIAVFVLLFLNRMNFDAQRIFTKTGEQYEKFSKPKVTPLWDMVSSWFLGGNVLFSGFVTRNYHNKKGFEYKALFMDVYNSWVPYVFVIVLFTLVFWSVVKNFKNKLVAILAISFAVDIVIHAVLKFGLHTSYIYGGHFVFVFPLLLGWLFFAYRTSLRMSTALSASLILLIMYLGANNIYRMQEFFDFLNLYYR